MPFLDLARRVHNDDATCVGLLPTLIEDDLTCCNQLSRGWDTKLQNKAFPLPQKVSIQLSRLSFVLGRLFHPGMQWLMFAPLAEFI
ncbi:MAG TPA: hypothetical protein VKA25_03780, partial [Gemmatimonadales bacterium]|nr:hypothetical protein [Gemmatimonadales bacterium]